MHGTPELNLVRADKLQYWDAKVFIGRGVRANARTIVSTAFFRAWRYDSSQIESLLASPKTVICFIHLGLDGNTESWKPYVRGTCFTHFFDMLGAEPETLRRANISYNSPLSLSNRPS
jgi:hypothetical protein